MGTKLEPRISCNKVLTEVESITEPETSVLTWQGSGLSIARKFGLLLFLSPYSTSTPGTPPPLPVLPSPGADVRRGYARSQVVSTEDPLLGRSRINNDLRGFTRLVSSVTL